MVKLVTLVQQPRTTRRRLQTKAVQMINGLMMLGIPPTRVQQPQTIHKPLQTKAVVTASGQTTKVIPT